jgi:hypothetical protein
VNNEPIAVLDLPATLRTKLKVGLVLVKAQEVRVYRWDPPAPNLPKIVVLGSGGVVFEAPDALAFVDQRVRRVEHLAERDIKKLA